MLNITIHVKQYITLHGKSQIVTTTETKKTKALKEVLLTPIVTLCRLVGKAFIA